MIPHDFKTGYRGIMLLHRTKDGAKGNVQRKSLKRCSSNADEWDCIIREFQYLKMTVSEYQNYRIYSSVNSRNMDKAIREFKRLQLDTDYDNNCNKHGFYLDVDNRFFSCFMQPAQKSESNFLFDCDGSEVIYIVVRDYLKNLGFYLFSYPTTNGFHVISKPFDVSKHALHLPSCVEIKKDGMIFIDCEYGYDNVAFGNQVKDISKLT